MKKIKDLVRQPPFQILVFSLCLVLFGWPLVSLSDAARVKEMFVYLFLSWSVVSFLLYVVTTSLKNSNSDGD